MNITYEKDNSQQKVEYDGVLEQLLLTLEINPETVIVARDGTIIDNQTTVSNSDSLLIISVISGG